MKLNCSEIPTIRCGCFRGDGCLHSETMLQCGIRSQTEDRRDDPHLSSHAFIGQLLNVIPSNSSIMNFNFFSKFFFFY